MRLPIVLITCCLSGSTWGCAGSLPSDESDMRLDAGAARLDGAVSDGVDGSAASSDAGGGSPVDAGAAVMDAAIAMRCPSDGVTPDLSAGEPTVTHVYHEVPGVDPNLLSLDVYLPTGPTACDTPRPIVLWVHGGGWHVGDKHRPTSAFKAQLIAAELGLVFVSTNYRLSPEVRHPTHAQDVARAVAWLRAQAARFGGDPDRLALLGHSAGGHLVGIIGTQPSLLEDASVPHEAVDCVGIYDSDLDVRHMAERAEGNVARFMAMNPGAPVPEELTRTFAAFGTEETGWAEASPLVWAERYERGETGWVAPSFQLAVRGSAARTGIQTSFVDTLAEAGVIVDTIDARHLDHEEVNRFIGDPDADAVMTDGVRRYLTACFGE